MHGDPDVFFSYENQLFPPSISDKGKLGACTKFDLIRCIDPVAVDDLNDADCKIDDVAALVHTLKPTGVETFQRYANQVFLGCILCLGKHQQSRHSVGLIPL